jgi:hypothetical protein
MSILQQFLHSLLHIGCHGNVFTEPLLNNGRPLWFCYSSFQTLCYNIITDILGNLPSFMINIITELAHSSDMSGHDIRSILMLVQRLTVHIRSPITTCCIQIMKEATYKSTSCLPPKFVGCLSLNFDLLISLCVYKNLWVIYSKRCKIYKICYFVGRILAMSSSRKWGYSYSITFNDYDNVVHNSDSEFENSGSESDGCVNWTCLSYFLKDGFLCQKIYIIWACIIPSCTTFTM